MMITNRRNFLALGSFALAVLPYRIHATELLVPVDFHSRFFIANTASVPADEVRALSASGFIFTSTNDLPRAVRVMIDATLDTGGMELSIAEVVERAAPTEISEESSWFVTYVTIAGAAGVEMRHAHGIFTIDGQVFELVVTGESTEIPMSILIDQTIAIVERTGSLADRLPTIDDVPDNLRLYEEASPKGTFDENGDRINAPPPTWPWPRNQGQLGLIRPRW